MIKTLRDLSSSLFDLIYPPVCAACGKEISVQRSPLCPDCLHSMQKLEPPFCNRCGAPIHGSIKFIDTNKCNACPTEPVHFDTARSVYSYNDPRVKNTIVSLKYRYQTNLSSILSQLLLQGFYAFFQGQSFDGIIPVPLHKNRLRDREFNQAELIAAGISKTYNMEIVNDAVIRKKQTAPQVALSIKQRRTNLIGAFENAWPEKTRGKRILVIDDVFTTGTTTNEVCSEIRRGGASYIAVLTLARAIDL